MTKPYSITQDLDTKEAEATNPLVRFYIHEIRKQATAIDPNCEASSDAFKEAVNSAQKAAQLESMRRAGVVIPAAINHVTNDTAKASAPESPLVATETEKVVASSVVIHSTKARRNTLTPIIELAQTQCRNPQDTAEVWAALQVLAEKKQPPLIGATEEGLQFLNKGIVDIFKRKSLGQRLAR